MISFFLCQGFAEDLPYGPRENNEHDHQSSNFRGIYTLFMDFNPIRFVI